MDLKKNIRERCHVNTNEDGDGFVGVKADTDDAVSFGGLYERRSGY